MFTDINHWMGLNPVNSKETKRLLIIYVQYFHHTSNYIYTNLVPVSVTKVHFDHKSTSIKV